VEALPIVASVFGTYHKYHIGLLTLHHYAKYPHN